MQAAYEQHRVFRERLSDRLLVNAERKPLFFTGKAIFPAPPFAAPRTDFHIQPPTIEKLERFRL